MNMLMNVRISLLFCLFTNALIFGQIPFPKSCQNVEIMKDFDVNKYMGKWYAYLTYPYTWYTGIKCLHHTYENEKNGLITINTSSYFELTNYTNEYSTTAQMESSEGLLKLNHMNINFHSSDYIILGTDYANWSVVYSCKNFTSLMHTEMVWILTRQRQPDMDAIKKAQRVMSNNDVSVKFLVSMSQTNCTDDETDVELNLTDRTVSVLSRP
ncbi:apolipoprotein D-like isoform 1-T1 [Glossina fuscipes fuscipes]